MIVLALDASTTAIGWALFDFSARHPEDLHDYGLERLEGPIWERLEQGADVVLGIWLETHGFDILAIETPVVYMVGGKPRNAPSAIKQAYMIGALGLAHYRRGGRVEIMELRPDERLTALGLPHRLRNPKGQVTRNVNQIYGLDLDAKKDHDIADAIALGWAARRRLMQEGKLDGHNLS